MAVQLKTFDKNVTTAGTRVRLSDSDLWTREVVIQAKDNTDDLYVGGDDVSSSNGLILQPLKSFTISDLLLKGTNEQFNLKDVWIDSVVNGDGVRVLYVDRDP